ncbi:hypothetical protein ONZ43_g172 [Nemania bipapillata]|uniref:Uncharacterized protein n=1 Tax=Nemania bipapillata TaxID=110536 RepID=A0ACC2J927_9PEZI|nr:hypothetical protein ONZ43_g172 [Nemania bipapillata]
MPSSHRSLRQWLKDHPRGKHKPDNPETAAHPSRPDRVPQHSRQQPEAADNPQQPLTYTIPTDNPSTAAEIEHDRSAEVAGIADPSREEALEQQATLEQQSTPPASQPTATGHEAHGDDEISIWLQTVRRFETEHRECYELIKLDIEENGHKSVLDWKTWCTSPSQESKHKWFRQCKPYLPSLRLLKGATTAFANLDPHKIAPLIVAGVFLVIEVYSKLNLNPKALKSAALPGNPEQWKQSLGALKENIEILDFIRIRDKDPEPMHQSIRERTGVDIPQSTAGDWFVETADFTSWIGGIANGEKTERLFWLKGSMGTGKTTLITSKESKAPNHETMIRALCCRLAWNSDGSVAKDAREVYDTKREDREASFTVKSTWEPLLEKLVDASKSKVVFVIDALDECIETGESRKFLEFVQGLSKKPKGPYFLISSLPHVLVGKYFGSSVEFEAVHSGAESDMKKFISDQIDSKDNTTWEKSIFCKWLKHDLGAKEEKLKPKQL